MAVEWLARRLRRSALVLLVCGGLACSTPTGPGPLPTGRWTGDGACLSIADPVCNLTVGCGHGQFARPTVLTGGTFEIDGTYRIEIGPVSIDPAPPAHFSGVLVDDTLRITVVPSGAGLLPATYTMKPGFPGSCSVPCL
jgi:hypothetical protein